MEFTGLENVMDDLFTTVYEVQSTDKGKVANFVSDELATDYLTALGATHDPERDIWVQRDEVGNLARIYAVFERHVFEDIPLSLSEASEAFGIKHDTLKRAILEDRLAAIKIDDRNWVTTENAVRAYVNRPRAPKGSKKKADGGED